MAGRYWISSNTGVRRITDPGVTARSTPTSNASGSTMDGTRGGTAMSEAKCRRPARALPPPVSMAAFTAAGFSSGLLLGASASTRLVSTKPTRSESASSRPASATTPSAVSRRGQVRLHRAAQQRVARPSRVGEPAVPPGRLHLRTRPRRCGPVRRAADARARRPAGAWPPAPRPGAGRSRPGSPGAACPWPRRRAAGPAAPAAASAAAVLIESVSALIISSSVGPGARPAIGPWSRTRDRSWSCGHRRARASGGDRARDRGAERPAVTACPLV